MRFDCVRSTAEMRTHVARSAAPLRLCALLSGLALALVAPEARAVDDRPTIVTDAVYIGARGEPGWALALGWDADFYLAADRAVSLGPAISLAVLSSDRLSERTPALALSVDVVRAKVGLNHPGGLFRPFVLLGGGFAWTRFAQRIEAPAGGQDEAWTGMLTVGAGADVWSRGRWGVTTLLATRIRAFGSERVPTASFEFGLGFRFGL
jgi:hypothetical protein